MSELSLVRWGASGPKVQVLTGAPSGTSLIVNSVKINPTRVLAFAIGGASNGYIESLVYSSPLNYYTVHYNSFRGTITMTLSGETLTISSNSYSFGSNFQVTIIED